MNKSSKNVVVVVIVVIVIALIVWYVGQNKGPATPVSNQDQTSDTGTPAVPVSETPKLSGSFSPSAL